MNNPPPETSDLGKGHSQPEGNLLLVDGRYFAYRSFFGIRSVPGGKHEHNAVYGFARDVKRIFSRCGGGKVGVVWDAGLPTERMALLPTYKQNRPGMPDELRRQLPLVEKMIESIGFANVRVDKEEADDVIASYTKSGESKGMKTIIATGDKDIFQLASDKVFIYSVSKKHIPSGKHHAILGREEVCQIWKVDHPGQIRDVLALMGDDSDNIPGVRGIGPVTAGKLIKEAGGLKALLTEPIRYTNPRVAGLLAGTSEVIQRNIQLVTLRDSLALPVDISQLPDQPNWARAAETARELGLPSLADELQQAGRHQKAAGEGGGGVNQGDVKTTSFKAPQGGLRFHRQADLVGLWD